MYPIHPFIYIFLSKLLQHDKCEDKEDSMAVFKLLLFKLLYKKLSSKLDKPHRLLLDNQIHEDYKAINKKDVSYIVMFFIIILLSLCVFYIIFHLTSKL